MEGKEPKRILVLGSAVIDVIIDIERLPKAGEDIPGIQKGMIVGGCAFNISKILDGLHMPHDLCVPVGQGMYANRIRQALRQGAHDVLIEDTRCDNGYSLSLVEKDGERTLSPSTASRRSGRMLGWQILMQRVTITSMHLATAFRMATRAETSSCAFCAARSQTAALSSIRVHVFWASSLKKSYCRWGLSSR